MSLVFALLLSSSAAFAAAEPVPLVIGHRGASGLRPEHTRAAYELAIEQGADYIEPDLVMSKDGVLVARHENEISETTDVAVKFPKRKTTKIVDGEKITGWFTEDFTLAEIKTLRAKERVASRAKTHDLKEPILTLAEVLGIAKTKGKEKGRAIGVYPETKHPTYFRDLKLPLEPALAKELKKVGWDKTDSPVFVQSFELSSLKEMRKLAPVRLVFLIADPWERPFDHVKSGDKRTYLDLLKPESLKAEKSLLYGIGLHKLVALPQEDAIKAGAPKDPIKGIQALGFKVHVYTFRSDQGFLPKEYAGDPRKEYERFYKAGVDGVFSDFPADAVAARAKQK